MRTQSFKAGSAKVEITPAAGTLINGDFLPQYARHIHDSLYAKALVMTDGIRTLAIIVVDICAMDKALIDDVKAGILSSSDVAASNIMISSTHTHGGGSVMELLGVGADIAYRSRLVGSIVEVFLAAQGRMRPAKTAFASVDAPEHVVVRRYLMKEGYRAENPVTGGLDRVKTNPAGDAAQIDRRTSEPDTALSYLAVMGLDGEWICVLANYSLHYVGDWGPGTITADYFGVFAAALARRLQASDETVIMMSNGTSGDVNIVDFLQPERYPPGAFEKSRLIGEDLAEKVYSSVGGLSWDMTPALSVCYETPAIAVRKPSAEEVSAARRLVEGTDYSQLQLTGSHTGNDDGFRRIYAREQLLLSEYPDLVGFPVQAMKIGSGTIGALAGELFAATGRKLKEEAGIREYFIVTMANGYVGYVPPYNEFELGGYETWRCRSSLLEEGAEDKLRRLLGNMLSKL